MREKRLFSIRMIVATGAVTTLLLVCAASASTERVLYSFSGADGSHPYAGLVFDASGNLFGTTSSGGAHGYGTVFELTPSSGGGWTETVLYSFCSATNCSDGSLPLAGVIFDTAGNLFGTTSTGVGPGCTQRECGTVFELSPTSSGWTEKVIYSFTGGIDGSNPYGGMVFDGSGNLYGTTAFGGSKACACGTVFELSPSSSGWTQSVIHTFQPNSTDGGRPYAGLVFDVDNNLYGTTQNGGVYGRGCVFRLKPKGKRWTFALLHSFLFDGKDGFNPLAPVVLDGQGNIYGTTEYGGSRDYGTVFKLAPIKNGNWKETVLRTFVLTDGAYPVSPVLLDKAGNIYGTTQEGGSGGKGNGGGIVFKLTLSRKSWKETVLYNFCSLTGCSDGAGPVAGLIADKAGALYGTTAYGTSSNDGLVFEVVP